jgi:hypothetical protein
MTEHDDKIRRDAQQDSAARRDDEYDEQLQQTNSEFRSGDAGDLGNDLRLSEEQELIKEQSRGEFPIPDSDDVGSEMDDVPPLDAEREALDVPGEDLHNTDEADSSDDPYNLGGQDT